MYGYTQNKKNYQAGTTTNAMPYPNGLHSESGDGVFTED